jgi:geranylgeranyl diphosphate synthase type I
MFGDPARTGKSLLDDLREGRRTVLVQYTLEHAAPAAAAVLESALGNLRVTHKQHQRVQEIMTATGASEYVAELAARETEQALGLLHGPLDDAFLRQLLQSMLGRTS